MTLIIFEGGQRDGQTDWYDGVIDPGQLLVFDGPDYLGVYQRSEPVTTVQTKDGVAEVWHSLS
jgi:hypothetical protein